MGNFHPFQPAYMADPYPYLARLRDSDPVLYGPDMEGWILTRYAECEAVLRDDARFSSDPTTQQGGMGESVRKSRARAALGAAPILANSDDPEHSRLRAVLSHAFRAREVSAWRERLAEIVGHLLEPLESGQPADMMKVLAEPLPLVALLDYIGVPRASRERFRGAVVAIMRGRMEGDRSQEAVDGSRQGAETLRTLIRDAAGLSPDGMLGGLCAAVDAGGLTEDEMLMLVVHVATAGNAATAFAIGNSLLAFARHPEAWATLRQDRALLPGAVEECLRYDSPTHITSRFALADAQLGGRRIRRGQAVHLVLAAANRDPEAFPDPNAFDIHRKTSRHTAFGLGIHFCLGAPLGRLEMEVALSELLWRFERLDLLPGGYEPGGTLLLRGPRRLVIQPVLASASA